MGIDRRGVVRVKAGVQFTTIAPAGFRLLAGIELAARVLGLELVITSACDGAHSGAEDPHHRGEAFDVRTSNLAEPIKDLVLREIMRGCTDIGGEPPVPVPSVPRSYATPRFFGFVEQPGTPNEHIHVQRRQGRVYP